jgi:DNA modification methylase
MAVDVQAADPGLLEAASYSEADLNALLAGQRVPEKRTDPDAVPDAPAEPVTVLGDVWLLGPHRLLCGDATSPDDLKRVTDGLGSVGIIYTDPPYGVDIVSSAGKVGAAVGYPFGGAKNGKQGSAGTVHTTAYLPVAGDGSTETAVDAFRLRASEHGKRVHPTQKPVALAQWAFGVIDPKAERATVLDAFAGSGSTLIAAHATWRRAALIEMEPAYADIICRRYQEHAGTKPVLESTGQPHDFTA